MFIAKDLNVQETGRHRAQRARRIRRTIAAAAATSPALLLAFGGVAGAEEPAEVGSEEAIAQAIESADLSEIVGAVEQYVLAQEAGVGDVLIKLGEHLQGV